MNTFDETPMEGETQLTHGWRCEIRSVREEDTHVHEKCRYGHVARVPCKVSIRFSQQSRLSVSPSNDHDADINQAMIMP
jgi:hypothetical protein